MADLAPDVVAILIGENRLAAAHRAC